MKRSPGEGELEFGKGGFERVKKSVVGRGEGDAFERVGKLTVFQTGDQTDVEEKLVWR